MTQSTFFNWFGAGFGQDLGFGASLIFDTQKIIDSDGQLRDSLLFVGRITFRASLSKVATMPRV